MRALLLLMGLAGCGGGGEDDGVTTSPPSVVFGGARHQVRYGAGGPCFAGRCFAGGTLVAHDFTGDGHTDLGLFTDERDGFRSTFAYLDLVRDDGTIEQAKYKDGRWIWVDLAAYPGLDPQQPAGRRFGAFMARRR